MDHENELGEEELEYDFECWHQFKECDIELRVEDDGEVAWAYFVRPPHEIICVVWLYNVCPMREELSESRTGAMVVPGVEPTPATDRITADEDVQCFGAFTGDGMDVDKVIVCVKGKMRALAVQGEKMAYTVGAVGGLLPVCLPAVVWARVPQELKLWAVREGCELVSFDI